MGVSSSINMCAIFHKEKKVTKNGRGGWTDGIIRGKKFQVVKGFFLETGCEKVGMGKR